MRKVLKAVAVMLTCIFLSCEEDFKIESKVDELRAIVKLKNAASTYAFDGSEGDPISLEMAKRWMNIYQEENPGEVRAHFFGEDIINQILGEEGAVGIRIYYATDEHGNRQLLLVGTDAQGRDLLPKSSSLDDKDMNIVADVSWPCPTYCPPE